MHNSNFYAFVALDLANQRVAEANSQRLADLAHPGESSTSGLRRMIARIALAVARAADDEVATVQLTSH
jgi:hypothetical protein